MARIPKLTTTLADDRYMAGQNLVSSVDRPWRHRVLRSYLEPNEQALREAPGLQDLTLMTLASGAEHLERNLNGRWESADLRVGDVWFVPPVPISWRWRSISDAPLSTVHLHIERSLIDSVALVPRRIRRVTDYIRANLVGDLAISELAAQAGLSRFHFARVFRRETGETPHQFVTRLRLEEAARLLRATDQTVLQIALAVGFENASHFSVQFKRGYGVTPLAYRLRG